MKIQSKVLLFGILILSVGCRPGSADKILWEYKTVDVSDTMYQAKGVDNELNRLAADGWEVVSFHPDPANPGNEWKVLLKRPRK